ncbi:hypothetical protein ACA910_016545 [Epithemia clementina (nom. ined.)]
MFDSHNSNGKACQAGQVLFAALAVSQLVAFTHANETPPCTFCAEGEMVNAPNREITVDFGPPVGEVTQTCGFFERLFPMERGECPEVSESNKITCLCSPILSDPTQAPVDSGTLAPSSEPSQETWYSGAPSNLPPSGLCGCQPPEYVFQLDFNANCSPDDDSFGPVGVLTQSCTKQTSTGIGVDTPFESIRNVFVAEYDMNDQQIRSVFYDGPFDDGAFIVYESIMMESPNLAEPPHSIGVVLRGITSDSQVLFTEWSVTFTNECYVYPVIQGGERTVGTIISQVSEPLAEYCPPLPTVFPSDFETAVPSQSPTMYQSQSPSQSPSITTDSPSPVATTDEPTRAVGTVAPSCLIQTKKTKAPKGKKEKEPKGDKIKGGKGHKDSEEHSKKPKKSKGDHKGDEDEDDDEVYYGGSYGKKSPKGDDEPSKGKGSEVDESYGKKSRKHDDEPSKGKGYEFSKGKGSEVDDGKKSPKGDDESSKGKGKGNRADRELESKYRLYRLYGGRKEPASPVDPELCPEDGPGGKGKDGKGKKGKDDKGKDDKVSKGGKGKHDSSKGGRGEVGKSGKGKEGKGSDSDDLVSKGGKGKEKDKTSGKKDTIAKGVKILKKKEKTKTHDQKLHREDR